MDYRAIGELIWFSLLGLSILAAVTGFTLRVFLGPLIRDVFMRIGDRRGDDQARTDARIELLEARLMELETGVRRIAAADDFQRELRGGRGEG